MIERAVSFRYLRRSPPKHIHDLTRPLHGLVARTGNRKPGAGHSFDLARSVAGKGHRRMDRRGSGTGLPERLEDSGAAAPADVKNERGCGADRAEERRVGKEGVSTGRSRWRP